jgi:nucleotide-binding universal stress UspA family protein
MRLLVCLDGSRWVFSALEHACRMLQPGDDVMLLTVCPRDGAGYRECGQMVLEAGERTCARIAPEIRVRTSLAVGDLPEAALKTVIAEGTDLLILGARGRQGMPYGPFLDGRRVTPRRYTTR